MTTVKGKKALLLDLDGTVLDTHELIFQCYDWTMRSHCGCEGNRNVLEQCVGLHMNDIFTATLHHFRLPVTDQIINEAIGIYRDRLRANESAVRAFPVMRESLVEFVRRGWRLAIVTTKPSDSAIRHLQAQDLSHLFEVVIGNDQCKNLKPHPEPFLKALEALGTSATEAVGVGDSEHDIRSARAAGMLTVGACWGAWSRDKLLAANADL